jgi:hypothetical protein
MNRVFLNVGLCVVALFRDSFQCPDPGSHFVDRHHFASRFCLRCSSAINRRTASVTLAAPQ